jgi:hypothetical protein
MGMARLLAKGWVAFCLFAGAHSLTSALYGGTPAPDAVMTVGVCTLLFAAMGVLFIGGYAAATDHGPWFGRLKPHHLLPGFNEMVFIAFIAASFVNQVFIAPATMENPAVEALRAAIYYAVPGQRALEGAMSCGLDGGRIYASAFAWLLAIVYLASSASKLRLTAGLIRLERNKRPEALGPAVLAFLLGVAAVVGFQLLYLGSAFNYVPCGAFTDVSGEVLVGLAPLLYAYLLVAALANLLAVGPE